MKLLFHVAEEMRSLSNVIKASQVKVGDASFALEGFNFARVEEPEIDVQEDETIENVIDEIALLRKQTEEELTKMREEALQEIEASRNAMLEEMNSMQELTYNEAKDKGYKDGVAQAEQAMDEQMHQAIQIKNDAKFQREKMLGGIESEVADIILKLTKHIIGTYVTYNKEYIIHLLGSGLRLVKGKNNLTIRMSGKEGLTKDQLIEQVALIKGNVDIDILIEEDMPKGTCLIEAEDGSIDVSIDTQLEKLEEYISLMNP